MKPLQSGAIHANPILGLLGKRAYLSCGRKYEAVASSPNQEAAAARHPSRPDNEEIGSWPFSPLSPGELHGIFLAQIAKMMEDAKGDYSRVMRTSIKKLAAADLLGPDEVDTLNKMVDFITATEDRNSLAELRGLRISLLERTRPGPLVLAIMSIAIDSATNPNESSGPHIKKRMTDDIAGALCGGFYGGLLGGVPGGILGAVIGGVALSR
jgi:hypothetical protein